MSLIPNILTHGIRIAADFETTVVIAMERGFDAEEAKAIVSRMYRTTPWDLARIRRNLNTWPHDKIADWLRTKEGTP